MNKRAKAAPSGAARTPDNWIQTFTGRQFWPLAPVLENIHIQDIAHALSLLCRFNGHCQKFYSVAEHSLHVAAILPPELAGWGLLHDASEAYLADLPKPIKGELVAYVQAENRLNRVIARAFDLPWPMPKEIKWADATLLATEKAALMAPEPASWGALPPARDTAMIQCYSPDVAEKLFLQTFYSLWPQRV